MDGLVKPSDGVGQLIHDQRGGCGVRVTVVGAGVMGLTCATRLLDAGHDVRVVADLPPGETTSAVAAAIWYPYLALPRDRVAAWGATTYGVLQRLARDEPGAGVRLRPGRELFRQPEPDPWWAAAVPDLQRLGSETLPAGYRDGWSFTAPVVDMPRYLSWLEVGLGARGTVVELRHVANLDGELASAEVVVSCVGLGARTLVDDTSLVPVRGQVVLVEAPEIDEWLLDDTDPVHLTYVIPRLSTVVVGGTALVGADGMEPDQTTADAVLERATALVPALRSARVLGHRVGLRPSRPQVRLELEWRPGGQVVHCYGHGGAGVTLSWGCADEVVSLVGE